ncbi:MAG TPA: hypothetical protein VFN68_07385 [Acidimicrobiales bacterium]|nr:hypothetical protein [Acidimicrobiales bacterium]
MSRIGKLATSRGALVVGIWTVINLVVVSWHFAFPAVSQLQELIIAWSMVGLLVVVTATVLLFPSRTRQPVGAPPGAGRARNGAPAAAFAVACLAGGLAWVFGVFVAYFALPLVAFCLARWRVEWSERRRETRS